MSESDIIKITRLQQQMESIDKKVVEGFNSLKELMNSHIESINQKLDNVNQRLDYKLEVVDDKLKDKASKWVENVMIWAGGVIGVLILGALMGTILIK